MSLEKYLEANTKAVNRLADLLERANIAMPTVADITPAEPKAGDWVPQEDREEVVTVEPTAAAPVEADTEQDASNDDDNSDEPEAATAKTTDEVATAPVTDEPVAKPQVHINDVIAAMKSALPVVGGGAVKAILTKYGVVKVSELDSRDLAAALADFEQALLA